MSDEALRHSGIRAAERLGAVNEYYFSMKLQEVASLNAAGCNVISLAVGSPDNPPARQVTDSLCATAHQSDAHGYQPTRGTEELRTAIADYYLRRYGVDVDAQREVLPLIGSKEGILYATLALCNSGDSVLVPNPGYPAYSSVACMLGVTPLYYDLLENDEWQPDFAQLEAMDTTDVKLMWVNYPHMPTGGVARRATFDRLVAFAKARNMVLINDNPYSLILNEHPQSLLQVVGAKDCCLEFNSLSKSHNMAGWRVGMCCGNATVISWMLQLKSNVDSGMFRGIQIAAVEAMRNVSDSWHRKANIDDYRTRRAVAERIMEALECRFDPKQKGMFLWGKIPQRYPNAEELTEKVLHQAHVFIVPGHIFGSNGNRYIRISLCASIEDMRQALNRIQSIKW